MLKLRIYCGKNGMTDHYLSLMCGDLVSEQTTGPSTLKQFEVNLIEKIAKKEEPVIRTCEILCEIETFHVRKYMIYISYTKFRNFACEMIISYVKLEHFIYEKSISHEKSNFHKETFVTIKTETILK